MGRRELLRVNARVEVEFRKFDQFYRDYTSNISKGGMFIKTENMLKLQAVIEISLKLPELDKPISLVGEVVHAITPEDAQQNGWEPGLGIQFVDFEEGSKQMIEEYVARMFHQDRKRPPDRRQSKRVTLRLRVRFPSLEVLQHDYSQDISKGGIFIQSEKPKAIGEQFLLTMVHPKNGEELEILGEVVRVSKADPQTPGSYSGMGIKFVDMDAEKHAAIDRFLGIGVPIQKL